MARPIVFLSDYGLSDEFVGICHGVIARIAPDAPVIDLAHGITPMSVMHGATVLASSVRFMPDEAVYLAVVDPGVGSQRRAVAVETASASVLIGPDNGLLSQAWDALGGATRAVEITSKGVILQPTSVTFHGRDVFAPAAAHVAAGGEVSTLGADVPVDSLARVGVARPTVAGNDIRCAVLAIDHFGNVQLAAREEDLGRAGLAEADELTLDTDEAGAISLRRARTFAEVRPGQAALIVDSTGWLAAAINGGHMAEALRVRPGDPVVISRVV